MAEHVRRNLILSPTPVLYPYVAHPDIMVLMSQEAFAKFHGDIKPGGTLIIEQELVRVHSLSVADVKVFGIPATRIAEELGKKMVHNIVMTGFFGAISGLLERDSLRKAVEDSVPAAFAEMNRKAFDAGYDYGLKHLETERWNWERKTRSRSANSGKNKYKRSSPGQPGLCFVQGQRSRSAARDDRAGNRSPLR